MTAHSSRTPTPPLIRDLDWCRCGILRCPDVDAHDFSYRSSETTWREASTRPFGTPVSSAWRAAA